MLFRDRAEAGQLLAKELSAYADRKDVVVLALPRGGVPVAAEVARVLNAPLDIFLVRKLGVPGQKELAMGAIATGNIRVLNQDLIRRLRIPQHLIDTTIDEEQRELSRREHAYRDDRPPLEVGGRTVILVDDGLATGSSMHAAITALREQRPARIVAAVPAAAHATCEALGEIADEMICATTPEPFYAVGMWYDDFSQVTDEQVREVLRSHNPEAISPSVYRT